MLRDFIFFRNEILYILTFCIWDLITSIYGNYLNNISANIEDFYYANLSFAFCEILLLPAYIDKVLNQKHNWFLPISLCLISLLLSLKYPFQIETIIMAVSGIYISFYCIKYLKWVFTNDLVHNISNTKHFWIIIGIMMCYTASIPSCLGKLFLKISGETTHLQIAWSMTYVFLALNIVMHCFFIKAFEWRKVAQ